MKCNDTIIMICTRAAEQSEAASQAYEKVKTTTIHNA